MSAPKRRGWLPWTPDGSKSTTHSPEVGSGGRSVPNRSKKPVLVVAAPGTGLTNANWFVGRSALGNAQATGAMGRAALIRTKIGQVTKRAART